VPAGQQLLQRPVGLASAQLPARDPEHQLIQRGKPGVVEAPEPHHPGSRHRGRLDTTATAHRDRREDHVHLTLRKPVRLSDREHGRGDVGSPRSARQLRLPDSQGKVHHEVHGGVVDRSGPGHQVPAIEPPRGPVSRGSVAGFLPLCSAHMTSWVPRHCRAVTRICPPRTVTCVAFRCAVRVGPAGAGWWSWSVVGSLGLGRLSLLRCAYHDPYTPA
jgi:hypothetical protein